MVIQNLVNTKQYFVNETKMNYYVVYEKFEKIKAFFRDRYIEEWNAGTEELIHIFYGNCKSDSVKSLHSYRLNQEEMSIEDTLKVIKEEHKEIFK
ncbi:hypothetical protein ACNQFZ_21445 [Schinkia sp. CFF1]